MIVGVGCDIIEIERVKKACEAPSFLKKYFTAAERDYIAGRAERAAGRFCAKEAAAKALGTGFRGFCPADIEILNDGRGRPTARFLNGARARKEAIRAARVRLTLSHSKAAAVAVCVLESSPKPERPPRADGLCLPERPRGAHKGAFGKVVIVAGSAKYPGAAAFCALGALRAGCGYAFVCVPQVIAGTVNILAPEAITVPLPCENGFFCADSFAPLAPYLKGASCAAIGPGMGAEAQTAVFLKRVLAEIKDMPIILDADALNLSAAGDFAALSNACVTPHLKEFERLIGGETNAADGTKAEMALFFAKKYGVVTLLKGENTAVASPAGGVYINKTGGTALAKAGAGDVLTGVIAGVAAQKTDLFTAASLGAKIHGLAGDMAGAALSDYGVLARDIARYVPKAIKRLETWRE